MAIRLRPNDDGMIKLELWIDQQMYLGLMQFQKLLDLPTVEETAVKLMQNQGVSLVGRTNEIA